MFACVACYFIWYALLDWIEGHRLAFLEFVHGVAGALAGCLLLGERPGALQLVGSALLLAGAAVNGAFLEAISARVRVRFRGAPAKGSSAR